MLTTKSRILKRDIIKLFRRFSGSFVQLPSRSLTVPVLVIDFCSRLDTKTLTKNYRCLLISSQLTFSFEIRILGWLTDLSNSFQVCYTRVHWVGKNSQFNPKSLLFNGMVFTRYCWICPSCVAKFRRIQQSHFYQLVWMLVNIAEVMCSIGFSVKTLRYHALRYTGVEVILKYKVTFHENSM